ncbi:MAG: FxDxF family PEP-CTERM protein [Burkholderiales bacterium]|nr:FxDxF family PEP-CTERM protein [Burkholderiales bacterium]
MKKLVCAAAIAGVSSVGTAAAPPIDLGTVTLDVATVFNGTIANGQFQDLYAFTLPANGGSAYSAHNLPITINFPPPFGGSGTLNVLLTTLTLFSNPDGVTTGTSGDEAVIKAVNSSDPGMSSNAISFNLGPNLAAGPMFLSVIGLANGSLGGTYAGTILAVSPVPEPEVWAMMLVGAGLVGFRLRHQSKRNKSKRISAARIG